MGTRKETKGAEGDDLGTLRALWRLQARGLLALLESGAPLKAAQLAVVNKFLVDNGVTRDLLERQGAGAAMRGLIPADLPTFDEPPKGNR